jgi:hypothetical protein
MTGTLMTTCYVMNVIFYLWYCCVMFHLLSLKSHSLGKVFRCSFLITMRKMISQRLCLGRTWLGWRVVGSISGSLIFPLGGASQLVSELFALRRL